MTWTFSAEGIMNIMSPSGGSSPVCGIAEGTDYTVAKREKKLIHFTVYVHIYHICFVQKVVRSLEKLEPLF